MICLCCHRFNIHYTKGKKMVALKNKKLLLWVILGLLSIAIISCSSMDTHHVDTWKLPAKKNDKSAMIIGRIGLTDNKPMPMRVVAYLKWGKAYGHSGRVPRGEKEYIMDNGYFVIPNIEPGKYWFSGFFAFGYYNTINDMPNEKNDTINIKPGEIKFVGSYDYHNDGRSFSLKPAQKHSELEIMQWLLKTSTGSGWEATIKQHIKSLSGGKSK